MAKRQVSKGNNNLSKQEQVIEGFYLLDEIWSQIFAYLSPENVLKNVTSVSRRFLGLSSNEEIWNTFCVAASKVPKGSCRTWKQRYCVQNKNYCNATIDSFRSTVGMITMHATLPENGYQERTNISTKKNIDNSNPNSYTSENAKYMLDELISFAQIKKKEIQIKGELIGIKKFLLCNNRENSELYSTFFQNMFGGVISYLETPWSKGSVRECQIAKLNHLSDESKCLYLVTLNNSHDHYTDPCLIFILDEAGLNESGIISFCGNSYTSGKYNVSSVTSSGKKATLFLKDFGGININPKQASCLRLCGESNISSSKIPCYFISWNEYNSEHNFDYQNVSALSKYLGLNEAFGDFEIKPKDVLFSLLHIAGGSRFDCYCEAVEENEDDDV